MARIGKFRLEVSYPLDRDMDEKIQKIIGKLDWASGAGFGSRDLSFDFCTEKEQKDAAARLKAANLKGIKLSLRTSTP